MTKPGKDNIELENFIDPKQKIETGFTIDPREKMLGFAKLKVPAISPNISQKIGESIEIIRDNLKKL